MAFRAERAAWEAAGEFDRAEAAEAAVASVGTDVKVPDGGARVDAPFVANVWKVDVAQGDVVREGQTLVSLEAMKMEPICPRPDPAGSSGCSRAPAPRSHPATRWSCWSRSQGSGPLAS